MKESINTDRLSNGIRIVHTETSGDVFHLGLFIDSGTRDEKKYPEGIAHLTEHLLFKGTTTHKTNYIINRLENVGADVNAYTTKEETALYASFLTVDFKRAAELFADIIANSTFPEKEINKEKDVVIDEINSYLDSPAEQIFDDFEEKIFIGHPLGRNILGTQKSIKHIKKSDIINYYTEQYITSNIVISTVGNLSKNKVKDILEKYFGFINPTQSLNDRTPFQSYQPIYHTEEKQIYQSHCIIGGLSCSGRDEKKVEMSLLANMLGGPAMNSLLNMEIREKHGYTYNIEANYQPYFDTGVFSIYLGTDTAYIEKSIELVRNELKKLSTTTINESKLKKIKRQFCGQIAVAASSGVNNMINNGKTLLIDNNIETLQETFEKIESISSSDLLELSNQYLDINKMSTLIYKNIAED